MRNAMMVLTCSLFAFNAFAQGASGTKANGEACASPDECRSGQCGSTASRSDNHCLSRAEICAPGARPHSVATGGARGRKAAAAPKPLVCEDEDPCKNGKGCPDGAVCRRHEDCASRRCEEGFCASCADSKQAGKETDVDCGGICPPCADGLKCHEGADCRSGACINGRCQAPNCSDGVRNGNEIDVDCGHGCPLCRNFQRCNRNEDCLSVFCKEGWCQTQDCNDREQNGDETGVDCGGTWCPPCSAAPERAPPLTRSGSGVVLTVSFGGGFIGANNSGPGVLRTVEGGVDPTFFGWTGLVRAGLLVNTWPRIHIAVGVGPTESLAERGGGMAISANAAVLFPLARWVELGPQVGYLGDMVFDLRGVRTSCGYLGLEVAIRATSWLSFPLEAGVAPCYDRRDDGQWFFGGYGLGSIRLNLPRRGDH